MKQSKPYVPEVILSELMAASFPLTHSYLEERCKRHAQPNSGYDRLTAFHSLESAGLVIRSSWGWETSYNMTDEGRSLLCQRPPYNCYRAIRDELAASGPLTAPELESACRRKASNYAPDVFLRTLWDMIQSGLVIDMSESGDAHSTYDLPEHTE